MTDYKVNLEITRSIGFVAMCLVAAALNGCIAYREYAKQRRWASCFHVGLACLAFGAGAILAAVSYPLAVTALACRDAPPVVEYYQGMTLCPGQSAVVLVPMPTAPTTARERGGGSDSDNKRRDRNKDSSPLYPIAMLLGGIATIIIAFWQAVRPIGDLDIIRMSALVAEFVGLCLFAFGVYWLVLTLVEPAVTQMTPHGLGISV